MTPIHPKDLKFVGSDGTVPAMEKSGIAAVFKHLESGKLRQFSSEDQLVIFEAKAAMREALMDMCHLASDTVDGKIEIDGHLMQSVLQEATGWDGKKTGSESRSRLFVFLDKGGNPYPVNRELSNGEKKLFKEPIQKFRSAFQDLKEMATLNTANAKPFKTPFNEGELIEMVSQLILDAAKEVKPNIDLTQIEPRVISTAIERGNRKWGDMVASAQSAHQR